MLRDVMRTHFDEISEADQKELFSWLGQWQLEQKDYVQATQTFYGVGDWDHLFDALVLDRNKSFGGERAPLLAKIGAECPEELLLKRPDGLLILMLNLYACNDIPEMLRLYGLFQQSMEADL